MGAGGFPENARTTAEVLADRLAAELIRHEPGWELPRRTALARRYEVSLAQIEAAVGELARRHLVRRLPDRRWYRASPAEYLLPLPGTLRSRIEASGAELTCRDRQASWREVPDDIGRVLRAGPGERVYVVHAVWAAGTQPAAHATAYLLADIASPGAASQRSAAGAAAAGAGQGLLSLTPCPELPAARWEDPAADRPASLQVELQPPPPSAARRLRLPAGQPAVLVTARFDDPDTGRPVALTVAVLRPELFRVAVQIAGPPLAGGDGPVAGS